MQAHPGHAQGSRVSLARRLSSVRVRGAPPLSSPIVQLAGAPVVTREIQVRILVGEPATPRSSSGSGYAGSHPAGRSSNLRRGTTQCTRSSTGQSSWVRTREVQVRLLPCAPACPRSSAEKSGRLLSGGSGVQVTPRAPCMCVHSSMAELLPSKQTTQVRFLLPAPLLSALSHVRLAARTPFLQIGWRGFDSRTWHQRQKERGIAQRQSGGFISLDTRRFESCFRDQFPGRVAHR